MKQIFKKALTIFIIAGSIILFIALILSGAYAEECKDCPIDKPCLYSYQAGDDCNTCAGSTWCINDRWYSDGLGMCTAMYCKKTIEISNPFEKTPNKSPETE
jgi:hypothetical protein